VGDFVLNAWSQAQRTGNVIVRARTGTSASKPERRALREAIEANPDVDILRYLLSGVLNAHKAASEQAISITAQNFQLGCLLPSLVSLMGDPAVYVTNSSLFEYIKAFKTLLAIVPESLLPSVHSDLCHELASRASHNAFSIRPVAAADGTQSGEFMGWGIWSEASFFNHSCQPNLAKERIGRQYIFRCNNDVAILEGNELTITYLGGDEKDLDVTTRRKHLFEQWSFWCSCSRCVQEGTGIEMRN
jgi:SET and MYND domain-containing protein